MNQTLKLLFMKVMLSEQSGIFANIRHWARYINIFTVFLGLIVSSENHKFQNILKVLV